MKNKFLAAGVFFFVAAAIGFSSGRSSWNGVVYLTKTSFSGSERNPAAIRRNLDFSKLADDELITASQKRLVTAAKVLLHDGDVGVELGHFVTRDLANEKKLACDFYNRMVLRFEADGIAVSGDKPVMEIEGPCRIADDITRIEPVWIPVRRILGESATDKDISFPDQEGVNFRFLHMGGDWPMRWSLASVRLYNDAEGGREVSISRQEMSDIRENPLVLKWSHERMPTNQEH